MWRGLALNRFGLVENWMPSLSRIFHDCEIIAILLETDIVCLPLLSLVCACGTMVEAALIFFPTDFTIMRCCHCYMTVLSLPKGVENHITPDRYPGLACFIIRALDAAYICATIYGTCFMFSALAVYVRLCRNMQTNTTRAIW